MSGQDPVLKSPLRFFRGRLVRRTMGERSGKEVPGRCLRSPQWMSVTLGRKDLLEGLVPHDPDWTLVPVPGQYVVCTI